MTVIEVIGHVDENGQLAFEAPNNLPRVRSGLSSKPLMQKLKLPMKPGGMSSLPGRRMSWNDWQMKRSKIMMKGVPMS